MSVYQGLPGSLREEVQRIAQNLAPGDACLLTGSLTEGLGNSRSDIDLYVVQADPKAAPRSTSIGFRYGPQSDTKR